MITTLCEVLLYVAWLFMVVAFVLALMDDTS
jgi:hypothetical protein